MAIRSLNWRRVMEEHFRKSKSDSTYFDKYELNHFNMSGRITRFFSQIETSQRRQQPRQELSIHVILAYCELAADDCKVIMAYSLKCQPWFEDLHQLYLDGNKIGGQGCKYFPKMKLINLKIDNKGCSYLSRLNLPCLHQLRLSDNKIGDQGCSQFLKLKLPARCCIDLQSNTYTQKGLTALLLLKIGTKVTFLLNQSEYLQKLLNQTEEK